MEVPSPRVNAMSWAFLSFLNYVLLHHIASLSYRFTTFFFTVCPDRNMTALFILESKLPWNGLALKGRFMIPFYDRICILD